ncbi:hypothetical protein ACWEHA_33430 [Amycolatopsis nivea]
MHARLRRALAEGLAPLNVSMAEYSVLALLADRLVGRAKPAAAITRTCGRCSSTGWTTSSCAF